MSAKAEELAGQLLDKTESGKLKWQFVPDPDLDIYKTDAEDGISFCIKRRALGDDKVVTFELTERGRVVLADAENNFLTDSRRKALSERERTFNSLYPTTAVKTSDEPEIRRFRLYSDLFHAARATAGGGDNAIEKARGFLARLA